MDDFQQQLELDSTLRDLHTPGFTSYPASFGPNLSGYSATHLGAFPPALNFPQDFAAGPQYQSVDLFEPHLQSTSPVDQPSHPQSTLAFNPTSSTSSFAQRPQPHGDRLIALAPEPQRPSQALPTRHEGTPVTPRGVALQPAELNEKTDGHLEGLKLISNPPDLPAWRKKLFDVDEPLDLTEEQSTQRYKRKPFISHYWDCRLKGRPPGTPKSEDPEKKKRKRTARERNLCDVKIKITEWFPHDSQSSFAATTLPHNRGGTLKATGFAAPGADISNRAWHASMVTPTPSAPSTAQYGGPGKWYKIQRVNGSGSNGTSDGVVGPHQHTLEESDRVKKNSVLRWNLKNRKEQKRTERRINPSIAVVYRRQFSADAFNQFASMSDANQNGNDGKKTYHKKATGNALNTVKKHSKEHELKLFGSCFCPFVQRVWISLEVKKISYQYIEVDPYKKPDSLLEVNPRGLLEDLHNGEALLPPDPKIRAHSRLWTDHVNRHVIPGFYRFLQEQDQGKQVEYAEELKTEISKLVDAADKNGPFFLSDKMSFVDIQIAPWIIRLNRVLKPYRGWPEPEPNTRWAKWVDAIEHNEHVQATTSTDDLYLDSYERYAENRPNTSQLAKAVNSGRGLP
ncbi:hypothetical protein B0A49_11641 [Cryomyces minteri]|uniref:GST C-terminal domain-containing protein n=1 Tax=Cryomyces minteri TaxID=331657 RepID=A0A4U0W8R5_9PEZI|nr:hypothetical protein B0A49_11641 [Cryomyces minteri]